MIGQRQIHQCITQLDFNDCHAKIQQVDSQATLGNGVVVQVTGELSNNGGPMRRFTQTFVLAQQSPKKYYVHNDIFRYQDEMVNDEEPDYNRAEPEGEEPTKEIINRVRYILYTFCLRNVIPKAQSTDEYNKNDGKGRKLHVKHIINNQKSE